MLMDIRRLLGLSPSEEVEEILRVASEGGITKGEAERRIRKHQFISQLSWLVPVVFGSGAALAALGTVQLACLLLLLATGKQSDGVVQQRNPLTQTITFEADGVPVALNSSSPFLDSPGEAVTVLYPPSFPEWGMVDTLANRFAFIPALVVGILVMLGSRAVGRWLKRTVSVGPDQTSRLHSPATE